jgi:phosphoribosylamine--glycine ligase
MKVLVIGQGGREHALTWKIGQSKRIKKLFCAPGNGGTERLATNVPIKADDIKTLCSFCEEQRIDLAIVGPEAPLAMGIVDAFNERGLAVFGPSKAASCLEASKIFTKELARSEKIPTAAFEIFDNADRAKEYIRSQGAPIVVKADGLAAGKGVIVAKTQDEAVRAIDTIMVEKAFGAAGDKVIVEECLEGEEASIIVVSDGEAVVALASSQDHKRVFDGDKGPNTGGMGAYSPAPVVTGDVFEESLSRIIRPAIEGMQRKGISLKGVLYAGVMITGEGPKLLEFNVRFGDPETQAIFPRMESDLLELMGSVVHGRLKGYVPKWSAKACVCVVMASGGYPGAYEKGKPITGIEEALAMEDVMVFHAGTRADGTQVLTDGGRVLNVVGLGKDTKRAIEKAYNACEVISFDGMHYRRDIGYRALKKACSV